MTETDLQPGTRVSVPWGLGEVEGRVVEVYGLVPRVQVVVELTPELSSFVVDHPSTVTFPIEAVRRSGVAV